MAKWPNHFDSGKQFQKGQLATLKPTREYAELSKAHTFFEKWSKLISGYKGIFN